MIIGAVPLYNVAAVTVLSLTSPQQSGLNQAALKKALKGIVTNPIILGIAAGLVWTLLDIPQPQILQKTVSSLSATATPLGLMALGASFDLKKALGRWKPAFAATAVKLVLLAALFLPIAVAMGVRDDKLVAALAMLASPTTVSSFVMARSMGHEGTLTASTVMLTTFFSILTLTLWLYLLRTHGLIDLTQTAGAGLNARLPSRLFGYSTPAQTLTTKSCTLVTMVRTDRLPRSRSLFTQTQTRPPSRNTPGAPPRPPPGRRGSCCRWLRYGGWRPCR